MVVLAVQRYQSEQAWGGWQVGAVAVVARKWPSLVEQPEGSR